MINEWKNLTKSTKVLKSKVDNLDVGFDEVIEKLDNIIFVSKVAFVCVMLVLLQVLLLVVL